MELSTVGKDMEHRWYALPRLRGRKQLRSMEAVSVKPDK